MREFKFSRRYFVTGLLAIAVALPLGAILRSGLAIVVLSVMTLAVVYDLITKSFLTYIIDEKSLTKRKLTKKSTLFYWGEVKTIARLAHVKNAVGVFGDNKKFIINPMIKDHKEMVRLVAEKCSDNPGVSIDPKVFDQ